MKKFSKDVRDGFIRTTFRSVDWLGVDGVWRTREASFFHLMGSYVDKDQTRCEEVCAELAYPSRGVCVGKLASMREVALAIRVPAQSDMTPVTMLDWLEIVRVMSHEQRNHPVQCPMH